MVDIGVAGFIATVGAEGRIPASGVGGRASLPGGGGLDVRRSAGSTSTCLVARSMYAETGSDGLYRSIDGGTTFTQ